MEDHVFYLTTDRRVSSLNTTRELYFQLLKHTNDIIFFKLINLTYKDRSVQGVPYHLEPTKMETSVDIYFGLEIVY